MAINAANIRTAITELLEGDIGTTRTVTSGVFGEGVWVGQQDSQKQAEILDTNTATYKFDVELGGLEHHPATPISIKGNTRIALLGVLIRVWGKLATEPERAQRKTDLAALESALDTAIQALCFPSNLSQTSSAAATNIVSGLLNGPGGLGIPEATEPEENWELKIVTAEINASAILTVSQAT